MNFFCLQWLKYLYYAFFLKTFLTTIKKYVFLQKKGESKCRYCFSLQSHSETTAYASWKTNNVPVPLYNLWYNFFFAKLFLCDWKAFIMLFVLKKGGKYFFIKVLCYLRNVWKILAKLPFLVKLSIYPWMGPMFLSLRTAKCPGSCLMSM